MVVVMMGGDGGVWDGGRCDGVDELCDVVTQWACRGWMRARPCLAGVELVVLVSGSVARTCRQRQQESKGHGEASSRARLDRRNARQTASTAAARPLVHQTGLGQHANGLAAAVVAVSQPGRRPAQRATSCRCPGRLTCSPGQQRRRGCPHDKCRHASLAIRPCPAEQSLSPSPSTTVFTSSGSSSSSSSSIKPTLPTHPPTPACAQCPAGRSWAMHRQPSFPRKAHPVCLSACLSVCRRGQHHAQQ